MSGGHATIEDTVWPVNVGHLEWQMRYGTNAVGVNGRLTIASVIAAYHHLLDPDVSQKDAVAALKRARRGAKHAALIDDRNAPNAREEQVWPASN